MISRSELVKSVPLVEFIRDAFSGVALEDGIGIFEAEAIDDRFTQEEQLAARRLDRDRDIPWTQISDNVIEEHYSVLRFMDPKGFRYHIPAYMTWVLNNYTNSDSCTIDSTIHSLCIEKWNSAEKFELLFSHEQKRVICQFLKHMAFHSAGYCDEMSAKTAMTDYWGRFDNFPANIPVQRTGPDGPSADLRR